MQSLKSIRANVHSTVHEVAEDIAIGTVRTVKGVAAGFIAGLVASWVMGKYQQVESRPVNMRKLEALLPEEEITAKVSTAPEPAGDGAAVATAEAISTRLLQHKLTDCEKKIAGPAVHYGYGAAVGALYGGLAEFVPPVRIGLGVPYATVLFLAGDEIAAPMLGLSKPPTQAKVEKHVSGLATHFVYGITLDIARRVVRRML